MDETNKPPEKKTEKKTLSLKKTPDQNSQKSPKKIDLSNARRSSSRIFSAVMHKNPSAPVSSEPIKQQLYTNHPRSLFSKKIPRVVVKTMQVPKKRIVKFSCNTPVSDLAHKMSISVKKLLQKAKSFDDKCHADVPLNPEVAALVLQEFGYQPKHIPAFEVEFVELSDSEPAKTRAPIVTIAGHVDHGKTTTLDTIRKTKIAQQEYGGITQSINAYSVFHKQKQITFVDTPGHLAFTKMRAHGINLTDIALLIVAADDSIQEQTIESIRHMQAAKVPIIVVINKIDAPNANPDKVRNDLLQYGIVVDTFNGDTMSVEISAKTGKNIPDLLDAILMQADFLELKAVHSGPARGIILESSTEKGLGACATVLLKRGQIKIGDFFVAGQTMGKVRIMTDDVGKQIKTATVSQSIKIAGFNELPNAGDDFGSLKSETEAKSLLEDRKAKTTQEKTTIREHDIFGQIPKTIPLVIKAPSNGVLEALKSSLETLEYKNYKTQIVAANVGDISASDIELTKTAEAEIVAFQVGISAEAKELAKSYGIQCTKQRVIYKAIEEISQRLKLAANTEALNTIRGEAEVIKIFDVPGVGCIIGCRVLKGEMNLSNVVVLVRTGNEIYKSKIESIQQENAKVSKGIAGNEYGIMIKTATGADYKNALVGDKLRFYISSEEIAEN